MRKRIGFRSGIAAFVLLGLVAATAAGTYAAGGSDDNSPGDRNIAMRDDCDPTDVNGWAATGGCLRKKGNVNRAEFDALVGSPLSTATVGHPAWRNSPSYLVIKEGTERARAKCRRPGSHVH